MCIMYAPACADLSCRNSKLADSKDVLTFLLRYREGYELFIRPFAWIPNVTLQM